MKVDILFNIDPTPHVEAARQKLKMGLPVSVNRPDALDAILAVATAEGEEPTFVIDGKDYTREEIIQKRTEPLQELATQYMDKVDVQDDEDDSPSGIGSSEEAD